MQYLELVFSVSVPNCGRAYLYHCEMSHVLKCLRNVTKRLLWKDISNVMYLGLKYAACVQLLWLIIANFHCLYNTDEVQFLLCYYSSTQGLLWLDISSSYSQSLAHRSRHESDD